MQLFPTILLYIYEGSSMRVVNNFLKPITKGILNRCKAVADSSVEGKNIAKRAGQIQNLNPAQMGIAQSKGLISGAFRPFLNELTTLSPNVETLTSTYKRVQRNMNAAVNKAIAENPNASTTKARIEGIKKSKQKLTEAINEIVGVNDIEAAVAKEGEIAGVKEAGKAMARLTSSLSLFLAGNFVPVPGMSVAGWIMGEKATELLFGKPFTKQAKNLITKK